MRVRGITLEVSQGFILKPPKESSISMEIPSNITLSFCYYLKIFRLGILFISMVNISGAARLIIMI